MFPEAQWFTAGDTGCAAGCKRRPRVLPVERCVTDTPPARIARRQFTGQRSASAPGSGKYRFKHGAGQVRLAKHDRNLQGMTRTATTYADSGQLERRTAQAPASAVAAPAKPYGSLLEHIGDLLKALDLLIRRELVRHPQKHPTDFLSFAAIT